MTLTDRFLSAVGIRTYAAPMTTALAVKPAPPPPPERAAFNREVTDAQGMLLPHYRTFSALWNTASRMYGSRWDEAMRAGRENAQAMRRDAYLAALEQERISPLTRWKWEIEADPDEFLLNLKDPRSAEREQVRKQVEAIARRTYELHQMRRYLGTAVWFGRYGAQLRWDDATVAGFKRKIVGMALPVHGDKIHYDDDLHPGIMIYTPDREKFEKAGITVKVFDESGPVMMLDRPDVRSRFIIAKHFVEDADYMDPQAAGRIGGVGLRDYCYWGWWLRDEMMSWMVDFMEKVGNMGILVVYYEEGNDKSKTAAEATAKNASGKNAIAVPVPKGKDRETAKIELIPANLTGSQFLKDIVADYFERHIERLFVGQTLSSGTEGSGLGGSGVAAMHTDTKFNLLSWDAENQSGCFTTDLVAPIVNLNFRGCPWRFRWKYALPDPSAESRLNSWSQVKDVLPVKASELRGVAGWTKPDDGDEIVGGPQAQGPMGPDGQPMPVPPGQPPGPGQPGPQGGPPAPPPGGQPPPSGAQPQPGAEHDTNPAPSPDEQPHGMGELVAAMLTAASEGQWQIVRDLRELGVDGEAFAGVVDDAEEDRDSRVAEDGTPIVGDVPDLDEQDREWLENEFDDDAQQGRTALPLAYLFSGEKKDSVGRRRCYRDGVLVPCPRQNEAESSAGGTVPNDWQPVKGSKSQKAWRHGETGRVHYGERPHELHVDHRREREAKRQAQLAKSPEVVPHHDDAVQAKADARVSEMFAGPEGKQNLARIAGAQNGARVSIRPGFVDGSVGVSIEHPDAVNWVRSVHANSDGTLTVENQLFFLKPRAQGSGFGLKAFGQQVRDGFASGVRAIHTCAGKGGKGGEKMNGYYTWARMGYDADLEGDFRRKLPPALAGAKRVSDLMATPEGRKHWNDRGYMTSMTFDLSPGSKSIETHNEYLKSKGLPPIDTSDAATQQRTAAIAERKERTAVMQPQRDAQERIRVAVPAAVEHWNDRFKHNDQYVQFAARQAIVSGVETGAFLHVATDSAKLRQAMDAAALRGAQRFAEVRFRQHAESPQGKAVADRYRERATQAGLDPAAVERHISPSWDANPEHAVASSWERAMIWATRDRDRTPLGPGVQRPLDPRVNTKPDSTPRTYQWTQAPATKSGSVKAVWQGEGERRPLYGERARQALAAKDRGEGQTGPRGAAAQASAGKAAREPGRQQARELFDRAVADPASIKPEELAGLEEQLHKLTRDELRAKARELTSRGSGLKADLVQSLLKHVGFKPPQPEAAPGDVRTVPPSALTVDPGRFQFKLNTNNPAGVTDELKTVKTWNPDFAGVISVWKDPADGKTYVVNGHHRHELATRLGAKDLAVRYIDAPTSQEARAVGALVNIAEGRGTAIDAAKFMRDKGLTIDDFAKYGVTMKAGALADQATTLTKLNPRAFHRLSLGQLDVNKALAVAKHLEHPERQEKLFKLLDKRRDEGKDIGPKTVEEMARTMNAVKDATTTTDTLWGPEENSEDTFVHRADLAQAIRSELARDVTDFEVVSSDRRAGKISGAGNVLAVDENKSRADAAEKAKNLYDTLANRSGPVADALNEGAVKLAQAKTDKERKRARFDATEAVRDAIARELGTANGRAEGPAVPASEEPGKPAGAATADAGRGSPEPGGLKPPAAPAPKARDNSFLAPGGQKDVFGNTIRTPRPAKGGTTDSLVPVEVERKADVEDVENAMAGIAAASNPDDAPDPASPAPAKPATAEKTKDSAQNPSTSVDKPHAPTDTTSVPPQSAGAKPEGVNVDWKQLHSDQKNPNITDEQHYTMAKNVVRKAPEEELKKGYREIFGDENTPSGDALQSIMLNALTTHRKTQVNAANKAGYHDDWTPMQLAARFRTGEIDEAELNRQAGMAVKSLPNPTIRRLAKEHGIEVQEYKDKTTGYKIKDGRDRDQDAKLRDQVAAAIATRAMGADRG